MFWGRRRVARHRIVHVACRRRSFSPLHHEVTLGALATIASCYHLSGDMLFGDELTLWLRVSSPHASVFRVLKVIVSKLFCTQGGCIGDSLGF